MPCTHRKKEVGVGATGKGCKPEIPLTVPPGLGLGSGMILLGPDGRLLIVLNVVLVDGFLLMGLSMIPRRKG